MRYDFPAWCFAMGRDTVEQFSHEPGQFFDPQLVLWYQDTDLLHRLRQAGRPPLVVRAPRSATACPESVGSEDPELAAWIRVQVAADRERFVAKHPDAALQGHALAG